MADDPDDLSRPPKASGLRPAVRRRRAPELELEEPGEEEPTGPIDLVSRLGDLEQSIDAEGSGAAQERAAEAQAAVEAEEALAAQKKEAAAERAAAARKRAAERRAGARAQSAAGRAAQAVAKETSAPVADVVPGLVATTVPTVPTVPTDRAPGWVRVLGLLAILLLATALGLGAAALVESGDETWSSSAGMQLVRASTTDAAALRDAQSRYVASVGDLSSTAAGFASVPVADLRGALRARAEGADQILVTAKTAQPDEAERLAAGATAALVRHIAQDQKESVSAPDDRLVAVVSSSVSTVVQTRPSDRLAVVSGALVGAGVLLLALLLTVLRRSED